jgi:hypothetical protein
MVSESESRRVHCPPAPGPPGARWRLVNRTGTLTLRQAGGHSPGRPGLPVSVPDCATEPEAGVSDRDGTSVPCMALAVARVHTCRLGVQRATGTASQLLPVARRRPVAATEWHGASSCRCQSRCPGSLAPLECQCQRQRQRQCQCPPGRGPLQWRSDSESGALVAPSEPAVLLVLRLLALARWPNRPCYVLSASIVTELET